METIRSVKERQRAAKREYARKTQADVRDVEIRFPENLREYGASVDAILAGCARLLRCMDPGGAFSIKRPGFSVQVERPAADES